MARRPAARLGVSPDPALSGGGLRIGLHCLCNLSTCLFSRAVYHRAMKLSEFIQTIGDAEAAKLFGVKPRTIGSWRRHERLPRSRRAKAIVDATRHHPAGSVDFDGIYQPREI